MRTAKHYLLPWLAALWVSAAGGARAADIKLIANASVKTSQISAEEIRGIFLATKASLSDGSRVEPVLLRGGPIHETFVKQYLGKSDAALETYYRSRVFTGKGLMPICLASDAAVVAYVAKTKGAIGYVSAAVNASGVKTLDVK
jgi:hypothetical protein